MASRRNLKEVASNPFLCIRALNQADPADQDLKSGITGTVMVTQIMSGGQGNQRLSQDMLVSAEHGVGAAATRGLPGDLQLFLSERRERDAVHAVPSDPSFAKDAVTGSSGCSQFTTFTSVKIVGPAPVRHDLAHESLTPARSRILESLQQAPESLTASALADSLGQHTNTVREHLEALVERGLATRFQADPEGRGRPAWRYSPSTELREPDGRVRDHAALAFVLAEWIARSSPDPEADAIAAGQTWGRMLTQDAVRGTAASARHQTVGLLTDIGFDPDADSRATTVILRRCPFLDVARQQSQIVCSAHLGMIATVVEAFGGDGAGVQLLPFADSRGCIVKFGRSGGNR